jgi:hypothetical protein
MSSRKSTIFAAMLTGVTISLMSGASYAQTAPAPTAGSPYAAPALPANVREVYLVRQDQSDCTNTTVPGGDSSNIGGTLLLLRGNDGNTTVKIAMTVSPNTTYHFYLKCIRQLGDIKTGDEGTGFATFTFPTSSVGSTFAFDMYPEGAPLGNKFQSATVNF